MGDQCAHDGAIEEKIRVASRYKLHAASLILKYLEDGGILAGATIDITPTA